MRTTQLLGALSLIGLAVATPLPQEDALEKRDAGDVHKLNVITEIVYKLDPAVVVWKDVEGGLLSTETRVSFSTDYSTSVEISTEPAPAPTVVPSSPAPAPPPAPSSPAAPPAVNVDPSTPAAAPVSAPTQAADNSNTDTISYNLNSQTVNSNQVSSGTSGSSSGSAASVAGVTGFKGIVYSPYNGNEGQSSCKSAADVEQDFAAMPSGYNMVRLYGVDCNQVAIVAPVAQKYGMKLFLGLFNVAGGAYQSDLASMASQLNNDWSNVHTVVVGNELVSGGAISVQELVAAVDDVKNNLLNGAGPYVVTVDTFETVIANPQLCDCSDYTAVNMHPFYDPNTVAATAGDFMTQWMGTVRSACPSGQPLVISETGWPWAGQQLNQAIPSPANQATAIAAIEGAVGQGYILLAAFNEYWINPGPYGIDQFFGIYGEAPSDDATPIS